MQVLIIHSDEDLSLRCLGLSRECLSRWGVRSISHPPLTLRLDQQEEGMAVPLQNLAAHKRRIGHNAPYAAVFRAIDPSRQSRRNRSVYFVGECTTFLLL